MRITLVIGIFFLLLAVIFRIAAVADFRAAQRQWTPLGKTRRRISTVFASVGFGLVLLELLWP